MNKKLYIKPFCGVVKVETDGIMNITSINNEEVPEHNIVGAKKGIGLEDWDEE